MDILAVIPARGGSKGIPGKNTRELLGKPMLQYTIEAALGSGMLRPENIYCSTESDPIARLARLSGVHVLPRPESLARDDSATADVLLHAIDFLAKTERKEFTHLVLLQPTSPLRTAQHIDDAISMMRDKKPDSVVSVCIPRHSPYLMKKLDDQGGMENFVKHDFMRRQEMPTVYALNGAIYITTISNFVENKGFYGSHNLPYIMEYEDSIDVDDLFDLELAEYLLLKRKTNKSQP